MTDVLKSFLSMEQITRDVYGSIVRHLLWSEIRDDPSYGRRLFQTADRPGDFWRNDCLTIRGIVIDWGMFNELLFAEFILRVESKSKLLCVHSIQKHITVTCQDWIQSRGCNLWNLTNWTIHCYELHMHHDWQWSNSVFSGNDKRIPAVFGCPEGRPM